MTARRDHLPILDHLRGIAVLLVLVQHLPDGLFSAHDTMLKGLFKPGYLGVELFFVLSGFLITRILICDRRDGLPLRYFLARRALRIFPIYYLMLLVAAILIREQPIGWAAVYGTNFFRVFSDYRGPLGPTWSLAIEEHFYLVWPVAVYLISAAWLRRAVWLAVPVTVAAGLAVVLLAAPERADRLMYFATGLRTLSLFTGAWLACHEDWLAKVPWRGRGLGWACIIAGPTLLYLRYLQGPHFSAPLTQLLGMSCISTGVVAWLIAEARAGWRVPQPIQTLARPLALVGLVSYGLYLYHMPTLYLAGAYDAAPGLAMTLYSLLGVGLTVVVAAGSYCFIESPILRLRKHFRAKKPAATPITAPDSAPPSEMPEQPLRRAA